MCFCNGNAGVKECMCARSGSELTLNWAQYEGVTIKSLKAVSDWLKVAQVLRYLGRVSNKQGCSSQANPTGRELLEASHAFLTWQGEATSDIQWGKDNQMQSNTVNKQPGKSLREVNLIPAATVRVSEWTQMLLNTISSFCPVRNRKI